MKIGILSTSATLYSTKRLVEAGEKKGHEVVVINHNKCHLIMEQGKPSISLDGQKINDIDVIIPRIGAPSTQFGAALIHHFDIRGVPSILTSVGLLKSRDKLRSLQFISKSGIGIPKSVFARHPKSNDVKHLIEEVGGTPVILKLLEGTHGTGVIKADSVSSARSAVEAFSGIQKDVIVQEFIEEAKGKDVRVFVVDEEVVGAMERCCEDGEFRSNLHAGGTAHTINLDAKIAKTAIESTKLLGLTVAGVDLVMSSRGPLVLEVNSSPGLQGIETATGIDIATKIIEAAEKKYNRSKKIKEKTKSRKRKQKIKQSIKREIEKLMI